MHTDSLEVLVSSEEQESTSSKCASEKNFVCSSDEVEAPNLSVFSYNNLATR